MLKDDNKDRAFLLDTGANRNLIDASVLTLEEWHKVDETRKCDVSNFNTNTPKSRSLGMILLKFCVDGKKLDLDFIVMAAKTLNYNLIGVIDILEHFLPIITRMKSNKRVPETIALVNQAEVQANLTQEEAVAYLDTLPVKKCPERPQQNTLIDQTWFQKAWGLFPRLQNEKLSLLEGSRLPYQCEVELKPGAKLFFARIYQLSERSTQEMVRFLKEAEEKGIIERGETRCRSAAFMVSKSDPSLPQRMVVDLRQFNKITVFKDANLPRTDQLFSHAGRGKYLSKLDLTKAFYHVGVHPRSRELLGITTQPGGYRFRRLPVGWVNSLGLFSLAGNFVLGLTNFWYNKDREQRGLEEIPENFLVYIDDILLVNDDTDEHKRAIYYALYFLSRFHLTTNLAKCELGKDSMKFLGRWISEGKVHCDYKHVDAIRRLPFPSTVREMRKWLGIVNFTRPFLPGIAEYQRRLNKIGSGIPKRQSNRTGIKWTKELVQDFAKVRDMVMETVGTSTYTLSFLCI